MRGCKILSETINLSIVYMAIFFISIIINVMDIHQAGWLILIPSVMWTAFLYYPCITALAEHVMLCIYKLIIWHL